LATARARPAVPLGLLTPTRAGSCPLRRDALQNPCPGSERIPRQVRASEHRGDPVPYASKVGELEKHAVLAAVVFAGGHISGGHYNPAVTLAMLLRGKLGAAHSASYVAAQLAAAFAAAGAADVLYKDGVSPPASADWRTVVFEGLFTLALAFVVLNVATSRATEGNSYFGLAIGAIVAAGACAAGGVSAGAFNPAVAIASASSGGVGWGDLWAYGLGEVGGSLLAVGIFRVVDCETS
jgi:aquaporin Z